MAETIKTTVENDLDILRSFYSLNPGICSPADLLVLAAHAIFIGNGFMPFDIKNSTNLARLPDGSISIIILAQDWNYRAKNTGTYCLLYKIPSYLSKMNSRICGELHLTALVVDDNLIFHAAVKGNSSQLISLEVSIPEYISEKTFNALATEEKILPSFEDVFSKDIGELRLKLLMSILKPLNIIQEEKESEKITTIFSQEHTQKNSTQLHVSPTQGSQYLRDDRHVLSYPKIRSPFGYFAPDGNLIGPGHPGFGETKPYIHAENRFPNARHDPTDPFGGNITEPDNDIMPRLGNNLFFD